MRGVSSSCCREHVANRFPSAWLIAPETGELSNILDHCERRLRTFSFADGFDIVCKGSGTKANPSWRFFCLYHGAAIQNTRKLEDRVQKHEQGTIISRYQRENTTASQLGCEWEGYCSFQNLGKRNSGNMAYILTMKCGIHIGHGLADDPFQFQRHLKSSNEYLEAIRQTKKYRQQVLPYSAGRRLVEAKDLGVILSARDYYNTVRNSAFGTPASLYHAASLIQGIGCKVQLYAIRHTNWQPKYPDEERIRYGHPVRTMPYLLDRRFLIYVVKWDRNPY